jgi:parallel beta-helix repeat protein
MKKKYKKMKIMKINKIILALLGVLLFGLSILSNNLSDIVLTNETIYDNIESNLKSSGFWNLTGTPIFIDGEATGIGAHNWTWAESQDWCSGSGNWADPYVIENITINGQALGSCIDIRNSDAYFIIKNCTVYNSGINAGDAGITLSHSNNGKLIDNNCSDNNMNGIYLDTSNNCTLSENILEKNYAGIYMFYSSNATLSGNTINNNSEWGIYVDYSNNTIISGNTVNNDKNGIFNGHSINATISGNIVNNCSYGGIGFFYSSNSIMWWNTAINNGIGIGSQNSYNITFWMNTADNNNFGIYLSSSSNNNLSENVIRDNKQYGANIFGGIQSTQNLFFNNSFLNNSVHAFDDGINNHWNNSIIGNYWDNYTGVDADHDGIGDTPYYFHGGTDYLPIVDIVAPSIIIKSPTEFEVFREPAPNFVISIDEPNLDKVWYSLNGSTNVTFTGLTGTVNQTLWDALHEGNVVIKFYANDSIGNIGFSEVTIRKDINAPIITINTPQNNVVVGAIAPNFNISIEEPNLEKVWYSINSGTNITFTGLTGTINQALWDALPEGDVVIKFYANDTLGRIGFQEVTVVKEITQPSPPGISGYNLLFLLGIISAVTIIIIKKRLNHLD